MIRFIIAGVLGSVAMTAAAAQFGLALDKPDETAQLLKRSQNYRGGFDAQVGYVRRRRADGAWVEPLHPFHFGTEGGWNEPGLVERTSWIYTGFVPQSGGLDVNIRRGTVPRAQRPTTE